LRGCRTSLWRGFSEFKGQYGDGLRLSRNRSAGPGCSDYGGESLVTGLLEAQRSRHAEPSDWPAKTRDARSGGLGLSAEALSPVQSSAPLFDRGWALAGDPSAARQWEHLITPCSTERCLSGIQLGALPKDLFYVFLGVGGAASVSLLFRSCKRDKPRSSLPTDVIVVFYF
jgi:hypothetical protein